MSLYKELKKFRRSDKISFHIPGHKFGRGLSHGFQRDAFSLDVTEFDETDDLQRPSGVLQEAQNRAAEAFGAGWSYYLTNGSSIGLHAAVIGCCSAGGKLLIDRSCHKSVAAAVVLYNIEPVFVYPEFDNSRGLYTGITVQAVERALEQNPDIEGAIITSPTYYGICSDIEGIAEVLHKEHKFLIVDEAHGAHFVFHRELPASALSMGADVCVQSAHKTLPALGQCSFLHINSNSVVGREPVERALRLLQTTSPSYLLMTSLDEAVLYMQKYGYSELNERIKETERLKAEVSKYGVIEFLDSESLNRPQDMLRLVADVRGTGSSGDKIADILKKEYGIYAEMSDLYHVVFVVTCSNTPNEITALQAALIRISKLTAEIFSAGEIKSLPKVNMEMLPSDAWKMQRVKIPLGDAEGRISAEIVAACPPGAAILIPGQRITRDDIEYLNESGICTTVKVVVK